MFFVELTSGILARSSSLTADSLDMLGDASVYALSLYAVRRGPRWKAYSALAKGLVMAVFGIAVLGQAGWRWWTGTIPNPETMGVVGALALLANGVCLVLLLRHRKDDINLRSTWLCSRNDIVANVAVLTAALSVQLLSSPLPDIAVGVGIALLFLHSAVHTIGEARRELGHLPA